MARKRMIDPNFWRDEKIGELEPIARLIFIGLWNFADDNGVGRANPKLLKADILPYDDTFPVSDFQKSLDKLSTQKLITLYEIEEQKYYYINNFLKYQSINRPTPSNLPLPSEKPLNTDNNNTHGVITDKSMSNQQKCSPNIKEVNIREVKLSEEKAHSRTQFKPPTISEILDYCNERKNNVDPERFFNYYESKGWLVGKSKMKNWQAAVRTWENNGNDQKQDKSVLDPIKRVFEQTLKEEQENAN